MKRIFIKQRRIRMSQRGVSLLIIIISIMILAVLATAIYSMNSTSALNQLKAQRAAKAFYLAESGIRVAASEFEKSTTVADKNATLISLQNQTFTINAAEQPSNFNLQMYPYWFYVLNSYPANTLSIKLYFPGNPITDIDTGSAISIPAPGIVKLTGYTRVGAFTSAPSVGTYETNKGTPITVTFTYPATGFPYSISAGSELYIGYVYDSHQAINQGGDLVFNDPNHTIGIYPPTNGSINIAQLDGIYQYTYESRIPQSILSTPPASFILHNIQPVPGVSPTPRFPIVFTYDSANPYDIMKTTQVYLGKTLGIQSKATSGN